MSSFTSGASLRRRCLVLSSDKENIISAQGPFVESFNVFAWENHTHQPTEQPVRVKVFPDLGAYVDTVLPLGATGHVVAVSNILHDKPNDEYRVYATIVHSEDLKTGGYALNNRFVVHTQPLSEHPCQPKVAVIPNTSKLLILTGSYLATYEYGCFASDKSTVFILPHQTTIRFRDGWVERYPELGQMRPMYISPTETFHFIVINDSKTAFISRYRECSKNVYDFGSQQHEMTGPIIASHFVHDMGISLISDCSTLQVFLAELQSNKATNKVLSVKRRINEIAILATDEPVVQIAVCDRQPETEHRMVATVGKTRVNLWTLTPTSFTAYGSIDCSASPVTSCLLFHRTTSATCDFSNSAMKLRHDVALMLKETAYRAESMKVPMRFTPDEFKNQVIPLLDHVASCNLKERCKRPSCKTFLENFGTDLPVAATRSPCDAGASITKSECGEGRILLAIAFESGDVKLVDTAAYGSSDRNILNIPPRDIVSTDLVAFCPVWIEWVVGGRRCKMECIKGVYALTADGKHVYRAIDCFAETPVVTTLLASDVVGQTSYVDASSGGTAVVAYGKTAIYLSMLVPGSLMSVHARRMPSPSAISACFAHGSHVVVCTEKRIVLMNFHPMLSGMGANPIELDGNHTVSAYGAIYSVTEDMVDDLQLSIVGTSNGRLYGMEHKRGATMEHSYNSLQALIDAPATNRFVFQESLSTPFISSDNERIVSTLSRLTMSMQEMIVMGIKGSIVRFSYARGKGLSVLETMRAGLASPLTYRTLTMLSENDSTPLIVAYKNSSIDKNCQSIEIQLLDYDTREPLYTLPVERNNNSDKGDPRHSDQVFVYGSNGEGNIALLTLCKNTFGENKEDSIAHIEGILRITEKNQLLQASVFPHPLEAVYLTSFVHANGKRSASVIGVHGREVIEARMINSSKLRPRLEVELGDEKKVYEHSCSDLLSTPDCSFLLIGCKSGEVLLYQLQRPEFPVTSLANSVILQNYTTIEKLSIFNNTAVDVEKGDRLLFAVMTGGAVNVYSYRLNEDAVVLLKSHELSFTVPTSELTLMCLGSQRGTHAVWCMDKKSIICHIGYANKFYDSAERKSFALTGSVSAMASLTVEWTHQPGAGDNHMHVVCVGTTSGEVCWYFPFRQPLTQQGVGVSIRGLACQLVEDLEHTAPYVEQLSMRVFILSARRVTINTLRVRFHDEGMKLEQTHQLHLHHFVHNPVHLSIEKSIDREVTEKKRNKDLPQRIIVAGGTEYEVLLLCPNKLPKEPALRVFPLAATIYLVGQESKHVMRNTTDRVMHVSIWSTVASSFYQVSGRKWRLEERGEATVKIVKWKEATKEGEHAAEQFVIKWRLEKDEKNEEEEGEVVVYVQDTHL